ncbi:serine/threonine-protein kinase pim-1-like [Oratosquilla oratoria]|uniref:serine/threonine-protein kinase pim-1-like n=1 Tax=Oratosquilla oratoria TaxID=337810 RepID=UPI003F767342
MSALKHYDVGHLIARGGFASVFAATRISDGRPVAIKWMPLMSVISWGRRHGQTVPMEAELLERVQNVPGVIELLDCINDQGSFFMIMELPPGVVSLASYKKSDDTKPFSMGETRRLFGKIVETVQGCFLAGVSHKDIKPDNVLLFRDESTGELDIRLIDFGCGELTEHHWGTFTSGTALYWPPEFVTNGRFLHAPAAVWSLGAILYHMVCLDNPFDSLASVRKASPPFPSSVPRLCRDLIMRCFDKDPWSRPSFRGILSHPWMVGGQQQQQFPYFRLETVRVFKNSNPKPRREEGQGLCHVVSRALSSIRWPRLCYEAFSKLNMCCMFGNSKTAQEVHNMEKVMASAAATQRLLA